MSTPAPITGALSGPPWEWSGPGYNPADNRNTISSVITSPAGTRIEMYGSATAIRVVWSLPGPARNPNANYVRQRTMYVGRRDPTTGLDESLRADTAPLPYTPADPGDSFEAIITGLDTRTVYSVLAAGYDGQNFGETVIRSRAYGTIWTPTPDPVITPHGMDYERMPFVSSPVAGTIGVTATATANQPFGLTTSPVTGGPDDGDIVWTGGIRFELPQVTAGGPVSPVYRPTLNLRAGERSSRVRFSE